ncbi:hypothetical protein TNIN_463571 [Trichonephila inaurata madagascariensis]|uniref:Uncharacterized protein n=1 Tax=Trichonephila inaurata madagascariensis TaxID=2747483 RepID=A0A8X6YVG3_9ARAC|nr:hypothetical protein TNIN_446781 [Trichonephila inaurata madagascariensis]GFY77192.1 hypothetical protein TNIN_463571 [Trichonephila inaurata madagascariensis]
MPLEPLTGIGSCAGESKGSYKKRRPNDATVRMRTGWRSRCKIRRLRSSEVSIHFLTAEGRESVGDDQRPGQANTVITSDLIDKVDDLVRSDRRVTLRMLALKVDVS